jgi:hypothetical protein
MDVLEFVVAEVEFPTGPDRCAEIVVNGTPLADVVERAEGLEGDGYAPLTLDELRVSLGPPRPGVAVPVRVLGCRCGTPGCSWVGLVVAVDVEDEQVVSWSDFTTSRDGPGAKAVGPFRFDRGQYVAALAAPRFADRPVRPYGDD